MPSKKKTRKERQAAVAAAHVSTSGDGTSARMADDRDDESNHQLYIGDSPSVRVEKLRLANYSVEQLVADYLSLPLLPVNKTVEIDKISIMAYDPILHQAQKCIRYDAFTRANAQEFPPGSNPHKDYMPYEYVSPVIIIDSVGTRFRIHDLWWFALSNIHDGICLKQAMNGVRLLPISVFIDEAVTTRLGKQVRWISQLRNLVGIDILQALPPVCSIYDKNESNWIQKMFTKHPQVRGDSSHVLVYCLL